MLMLAHDWPQVLGANRHSDASPPNRLTEGVNADTPIRMTVSLSLIAKRFEERMNRPFKINIYQHLLKPTRFDTRVGDNGKVAPDF